MLNGSNLKQLREAAELSQSDLARLVEVDPSHIWRLEANKRDCLSATLRKIADELADALDQSIGDVLKELTDD